MHHNCKHLKHSEGVKVRRDLCIEICFVIQVHKPKAFATAQVSTPSNVNVWLETCWCVLHNQPTSLADTMSSIYVGAGTSRRLLRNSILSLLPWLHFGWRRVVELGNSSDRSILGVHGIAVHCNENFGQENCANSGLKIGYDQQFCSKWLGFGV